MSANFFVPIKFGQLATALKLMVECVVPGGRMFGTMWKTPHMCEFLNG